MLIAIAEDRAEELLRRLKEHYLRAAVIGRVVQRGLSSIVVT
jgi:hydrogenase maturation factor